MKKELPGDNAKPTMAERFEQLEYAKNAVRATLKSARCMVDNHGIAYWATEVERLRKEITAAL